MIQECPHCHRMVIPREKNLCPSCGGNILDRAGTDPDMTLVVLRDGQSLPGICIHCGRPTDRFVWVEFQRKPEKKESASESILGFGFLGHFLGLFFSLPSLLFPPRGLSYMGKIPQCRLCASMGKVRPEYVDFEHSRAAFLAHKKFKAALGNRPR